MYHQDLGLAGCDAWLGPAGTYDWYFAKTNRVIIKLNIIPDSRVYPSEPYRLMEEAFWFVAWITMQPLGDRMLKNSHSFSIRSYRREN